MKKDENKLSPEQIENFRRVLAMQIGAYAFLMKPEEIQRYRDTLQKKINKVSKPTHKEAKK